MVLYSNEFISLRRIYGTMALRQPICIEWYTRISKLLFQECHKKKKNIKIAEEICRLFFVCVCADKQIRCDAVDKT